MPLTTIEKTILGLILGLIIFIILWFIILKSSEFFEKQAIISQLNNLASDIQEAGSGIQKERDISLSSVLQTSVIFAQKGSSCNSDTDCPSFWECVEDQTDSTKKCFYSKTEYDLCRAYTKAHASEEVQGSSAFIYYLFKEEHYACILKEINSIVEFSGVPSEIPEYVKEQLPTIPHVPFIPELSRCTSYSLLITQGENSGTVAINITSKESIC